VRPIATLNEGPLHAALKAWIAQPGDRLEIEVDGFVIDIARGDLLIEVQTRNVAAIKRKISRLIDDHRVRLVLPVARDKWIVRLAPDGHPLSRRRSPKRGIWQDLFAELVSVPALLAHPGFTLEALLIQEDEYRRHDPRGWRRGGWATHERRLLRVVERRVFESPADLLPLLPADLAEPFTTADLAAALGRPRRLAQQMAYCLRALGVIAAVGKRQNAALYTRAP
jgi:hypothetical protein